MIKDGSACTRRRARRSQDSFFVLCARLTAGPEIRKEKEKEKGKKKRASVCGR